MPDAAGPILGAIALVLVLIVLSYAANKGMRVECTYGKFYSAHRCNSVN